MSQAKSGQFVFAGPRYGLLGFFFFFFMLFFRFRWIVVLFVAIGMVFFLKVKTYNPAWQIKRWELIEIVVMELQREALLQISCLRVGGQAKMGTKWQRSNWVNLHYPKTDVIMLNHSKFPEIWDVLEPKGLSRLMNSFGLIMNQKSQPFAGNDCSC